MSLEFGSRVVLLCSLNNFGLSAKDFECYVMEILGSAIFLQRRLVVSLSGQLTQLNRKSESVWLGRS